MKFIFKYVAFATLVCSISYFLIGNYTSTINGLFSNISNEIKTVTLKIK